MDGYTHLDDQGRPRMVGIQEKEPTFRTAKARVSIEIPKALYEELSQSDSGPKGSILHTCVIAGIQGAKKCSEIIPLCHPIALEKVEVIPFLEEQGLCFEVNVSTHGRTGVEMEAMCGASAAALTFYDMVKARFRALSIGPIELLEKIGGRSGVFKRSEAEV